MISLVAQTKTSKGRAAVKRCCKTLSIGRSSYYRGRCGRPDPDLELRDGIHKLSLSWPSYGYRPMTRALQRMGYLVNHKRAKAPHARGQPARPAAQGLRIDHRLEP